MAIYRIEVPSGQTAITAATLNDGCTIENFHTEDEEGFRDIVSQGHFSFDGTQIKMTASTNPSDAVRDGYMRLTYTINGNNCNNTIHLVQAAGMSGFKVNVTVPSGKASAYVSLYDANNTFLCGISRYQGGTIGAVYNWTAQGTVAKVAVTENGSNCKYLTINGKVGNTLLAKHQINTGTTVTNLDLNTTFSTSDYNDGNAILYLTFADS